MASSDWSPLANILNDSDVKRGVTAGNVPPNGGGTFVFGFATKTNTPGGVGFYCNLANFSPTAKGASVSGAFKKSGGSGDANHCVFLFLALQNTDINGIGYILGLTDDATPRLVLRKGALISGLPDDPVGSSGILARSTDSFAIDGWLHVKLEAVSNPSGDVVLNVYKSDLVANPVTAPVWAAVDGMKDYPGGITETAFIDDALGVNSGSLPLAAGRVGFGMTTSDVGRAVYLDHLTIARDT